MTRWLIFLRPHRGHAPSPRGVEGREHTRELGELIKPVPDVAPKCKKKTKRAKPPKNCLRGGV
jgi:hypothetical protein